MTCIEFKTLLKDYFEGRLPENRRVEFNEHLLSCEYCRKEMGEDIANFISGDEIGKKGEGKNKYVLFFVAFIILIFLTIISMQYLKIREYRGGEIKPLSEQTRARLGHIKKESKEHKVVDTPSTTSASDGLGDSSLRDKEELEDFSEYSKGELLRRLSECSENREYRCIASLSLYLAKKSEGSERKKFRLNAIEALVETGLCSNAMLNIMQLLKENPEPKEVLFAHFLNAKCYVKEKNYLEAEKILSMIEKDAKDLQGEIKRLREEIKKGEEDGEQTKSKGVQDRDSP
ncbi:MAG: anti-sigma factor family protein [Myxococcota bacterium]